MNYPYNLKISSLIIILIIFFAFKVSASPVEANIVFDNINIKNGLPHSTVFGIAQDKNGFIWFGTRNGIVKFDGQRMTVFQNNKDNPHSLSHNDSGGILIDQLNMIWIRTWGGGLNRFDRKTGKFERFLHDKNKQQSISSNRIQYIYEDRTGNIWAGTFKSGLNRFDRKTKTFKRYLQDPKNQNSISNNRVWSVVDDDNGYIWIATDNGLNRLNPKTDEFKHFYKKQDNRLKSDNLRMLKHEKNGRIWVASSNGINLFDPYKNRFVKIDKVDENQRPFSNTIVNYVLQDKNTLWTATMDKGIFKTDLLTGNTLNFKNKTYFNHSLSHNDVRYIFKDNTDSLWFATRGGGVCKTDSNRTKFYYHIKEMGLKSILPNNDIHSLLFDKKNNLWTGSWYGGLGRYNFTNKNLKVYPGDKKPPHGLGAKDINSLCQDKNGLIFIGTWGQGIKVFNPFENSFYSINSLIQNEKNTDIRNVTSIISDKPGVIWSSSRRNTGILRHDINLGKINTYNKYFSGGNLIEDFSSSNLYLDKTSNTLYASTENEIVYYDSKNDLFRNLKGFNLNDSRITSLSSSLKSGLLIGTYNNGLITFNNKKVSQFSRNQGLSGNLIKSIIKDKKNRIFIATENSISYFNEINKGFLNFIIPADFNPNSWTINSDGKIYIGSKKGIVEFDPEKLEYTPKIGKIFITGFYLFNEKVNNHKLIHNRKILTKPIEDTKKIELTYKENFFSISFAVTDYKKRANFFFKYKLDGYDRDWIDAKNNSMVSYSNILPGKYQFMITWQSPVDKASYKTKSLEIVIKPPFWKRWYFYSPISFLIIVGLIHFISWKFRLIKIRNLKLEKMVSERTKEIEKQNKKLKILSITDPLTKLFNRRGFIEKSKDEFIRYKRNKNKFSVIICDIDHFKKINDNYGHDFGDHVICEIANLLKENIREQDIVGRWGGEEFILLLPGTDVKGAYILAQKLRKKTGEKIFKKNKIKIKVTITLGVSEICEEEQLNDTIIKADQALYKGKTSSRNCVTIWPFK